MAEEAHLSEHLGSAKRSRRCWLIHLGHFSVTHRAAHTRTHHHHRHCVSQPARTWTTPRRLHHVQLAVVRRDEGTSVQYSTVQQHDCSINDKSVQGSSTHIVISPLHGSVSGIAHGSATPIKCTHAHGSTNTRDHTSVQWLPLLIDTLRDYDRLSQ